MKFRALRVVGIQRLARILGPALLALAISLPTAAAERPSGATVEKKWFPGHYVMVSPDIYHRDEKSHRVLRGNDGHLFAGLFMYVTWGEIETARGKFAWEKIDRILDALPPGKKFAFSLSWQGWHGAEACPPDMRGNPLYDGGQWPCWMGVEWQDLMPKLTGPKFPDDQISSANLTKTNFIWWVTTNRRKDGGYDFDTDVLNYLRANPTAGITSARPPGPR